MRAFVAFAFIFLSGCAAAPPTPNTSFVPAHPQKYQVGEKRFLSRYSEMVLWDGPPTSGKFDLFGTGPGIPITGLRNGRQGFVIESYTPAPNEGYVIKFDNGKHGWVKELDLLLTDDEEDHRKLVAAAKRSKAECDRRGGVRIGMTAAQVKASCWGAPQSVNKTTTAGGTDEQWVYGGSNYVYLTNGIVSAIQH
jgi:hypothetical protein